MKPIYTLFLAALCMLVLFSCKKNEAGDPEPPVIEELKPEEVTQSISVHYGKLVTGNFPAASASGPQLNASSNNQSGLTYSGGYIIIQPDLVGEGVAGYHLKITGDDKKYFNIDFSNPVSGRLQKIQVNRSHFRNPASLKQMDADYDDSSIVIKLNEAFKPGTFCVEYQAYDSDGNFGNPIKYCVTVLEPGNDKRLVGKWQVSRHKSDFPRRKGGTNSEWTDASITYGEMRRYICKNNELSDGYYYPGDDTLLVPATALITRAREYEFYEDGSYDYHLRLDTGEGGEVAYLDLERSSCTDFKYSFDRQLRFWFKGGWTYNAATKQLLLIDLMGKTENTYGPHDWQPVIYIQDYINVESISGDIMVLGFKDDHYNRTSEEIHEWLEFKKVK